MESGAIAGRDPVADDDIHVQGCRAEHVEGGGHAARHVLVAQVGRIGGLTTVGGGAHAVADGVVSVGVVVAGEQDGGGIFLPGRAHLAQGVVAVGPA